MLSLFTSLFSHKTQDVIVFSDVSWNSISHFSRYLFRILSNQGKILFIETAFTSHLPYNEKVAITYPEKNISIFKCHITIEQIKRKLPLFIAKQLRKQKIKDPILWFCSPACSEIIHYLNHSLVVAEYYGNDDYLFLFADVVFTKDYFPAEEYAVSAKLWNKSSTTIENNIKHALKRKKEVQLQLTSSHAPLVPQLISGG